MQINLHTIRAFLAEVAVRKEQGDVAEDLVRVQVEVEPVNKSLDMYSLRAAFLDMQGDLYQFVEKCGVDPAPYGQDSGKKRAEGLQAELLDSLTNRLKLTVMEGQFVG